MADEMADRIKRLEDEVNDLKAIQGAGEELAREAERDAEDDEPFGLDRLRTTKRKTGLPNQIKETSNGDED